MNATVSNQLDRIEDLANKVQINRYLMEYLGEWLDAKAGLYKPDSPDMSDGELIQNRYFLKENLIRYREILGQAADDAAEFQTTLMDIRQQIAEITDVAGNAQRELNRNKEASHE